MSDAIATIEAPAAEAAPAVVAPADATLVTAPAVEAAKDEKTLVTAPPADETPEQKTAREAAEAAAAETPEQKAEREAKEKAEQGAPEAYADFTLPEGITLDETAAESFKAKAKAANLTQEQAQAFVDEVADMRKRDAAAILDVRKGWLESSQKDPEFGGDKLDANLATAKRGLDAYGSPALKGFLDQTGLGNHPEVIRLLVNAGKTVSEDAVVPVGRPATANGTLAQRIFGPVKE